MDNNLKTRREQWLNLSQGEYDSVRDLFGFHLRTQLESYAIHSVSKLRESELDASAKRRLGRIWEYVILGSLALSGATLFTAIPGMMAEKLGLSDLYVTLGKTFLGLLVVLVGHGVISELLKEVLLYMQRKAATTQANETLAGASTLLDQCFKKKRLDFMKERESSFCPFPNFIPIILSIFFSVLEVGGICLIVSTSDDDSISTVTVAILCLFNLFLLWGLSLATAYYKKAPITNVEIIENYFSASRNFEESYRKSYPENDGNSSRNADYYLSRMEGMYFDEIECIESVIDYLLHRQRLGDSRGNSLLITEGELNYYKKLLVTLKNEDSNRRRTSIKEIIDSSENLEEDISKSSEADGKGGSTYHLARQVSRQRGTEKASFDNDNERSREILLGCETKINSLTEKLNELMQA
jgi:hypothetical protein